MKISTTIILEKKARHLIAATALLLCAAALTPVHAALTKDFYKASSVLSEGKWVKVGVETTGVYEISYATLREMGFADPSKVSVYGRGGRALSESFVTNAGVPVITDDLSVVKVIHEDNKLYFYGLGPEEVTFDVNAEYPTGGYFTRKGNNIYTKRGYYFLTDSKSVVKMNEKSYDSSSANIIESGVSFIYHELDSLQNSTNTGQLFWGERLGSPFSSKRTWSVTMPDAIGGEGVMECVLYIDPESDYDWVDHINPTIRYGFTSGGYFETEYNENTLLYYAPHQPTIASVEIPGNRGEVFVEFDARDIGGYSNLDYWVVSYKSGMPTFTENGQQLIALPAIAKNTTGQLVIKNPASVVALDVSTPTDPQRLKISQQGANGIVGVRNVSKTPIVVLFDKDRPQLQISGYEADYVKIENQNLHAYQEQGVDLIIVSTPRFLPYAEEIAQLHRNHDGIKVVVVTTEQCYNEFSGGTPDPMAIRSFAKMLYFNEECQPKNILLFGPLYGDFRGIQTERDPLEGIIAYQSPQISVARGAHNINDFYGMMSDKFRVDYYERNEVNLGVGILPVKFETDARIVVNKIRRYLERDDHAYFLNLFTGVGGIGDKHTHDTQIHDLQSHIRALDNTGTIFTPLAIDTYGNTEARKKFISKLNEGCNMFCYFGHGAEQFLGKDKYFFNAGDVYALRNKTLPFALFGGCQIANTDRGLRGLGETIVTSTEYGTIGSIVSSRDTWSGQNFEFFKQFFTCLYTQGATTASAKRIQPVTIGEVYASVKNISTYSNELAYQLLCDPALVIPTINRSILASAKGEAGKGLQPGEKFSLTGWIEMPDGNKDTSFNGKIVVRLNEPEKTVGAGMIESKEDPGTLTYVYRDEQASITVAEVKNGQFDAEIHVPASLDSFRGQKGLLYFCAYDQSTKTGAAQCYTVEIGDAPAASSESQDKVSPTIERLEFDGVNCSISLTVSDNFALNMSTNPLNKGLFLYIDGKERSEAHYAESMVETARAAYTKNVMLDGLSYGEHSARLKVKDAAGNITEQEIIFTYNPRQAKYSIVKDDENSSASVTIIKIEGQAPSKSTLVVLSSKGEEVYREEFQGTEVSWIHEGFARGHYKAYILETGTSDSKGHSDPIDIPVI